MGAYFSIQPFEIQSKYQGENIQLSGRKSKSMPQKGLRNLAELVEENPKYRKLDAKTKLFEGNFSCKVDLIRTLASTGERGPIGFGLVTIKNGKVSFKDLNWNTGTEVKWSDIEGFSSLHLKADGHLYGVLPVLTMFGDNRIELFEFSGENRLVGEQIQVAGFSK